jgi:hypothetical protein
LSQLRQEAQSPGKQVKLGQLIDFRNTDS